MPLAHARRARGRRGAPAGAALTPRGSGGGVRWALRVRCCAGREITEQTRGWRGRKREEDGRRERAHGKEVRAKKRESAHRITELGYAQLESRRTMLGHLQLVTHHQRHAQEKKAMQIALVLGCFAILKCSKECRLRH